MTHVDAGGNGARTSNGAGSAETRPTDHLVDQDDLDDKDGGDHDHDDGADRAERAREGVEHLQAAGRELIAAARAALDVAEDLLDDPEMAASLAGAVGSLGDLVRNVTASWRGTPGASGARSAAAGRVAGDGGSGPPDDGVERIVVT